jgi:hypothetical protein
MYGYYALLGIGLIGIAIIYKKRRNNYDNDCPICFEQINKSICCVSCNKKYHSNCIEQWLNNSHTCPCCRNNWHTTQQPQQPHNQSQTIIIIINDNNYYPFFRFI